MSDPSWSRRGPAAAGVAALLALVLGPRTDAQYPPVLPELGTDAPVETGPQGTSLSTLPDAVATSDGAIHIVWQDLRGPYWAVRYRRRADLGSAFDPEIELSAFPVPPPGPMMHTRPRIATDGDSRVYVVWHATDGTTESIVFVRSEDGGASWTAPALAPDSQLNGAIATEYAGRPAIAADASGRVHVVWAQSDLLFDQIYAATSLDGGASWTVPVLGEPLNLVSLGHSEAPVVACDGGGAVYCAWLDHRDPAVRVPYLRRSVDGGVSWEPGETRLGPHRTADRLALVAHGGGGVDGSPLVLAAWIDIAEDALGLPVTRVMANWSTDGGIGFRPLPALVDAPCPGTAGVGTAPVPSGPLTGPGPPPGPAPGTGSGIGSGPGSAGRIVGDRSSGTEPEVCGGLLLGLDLAIDGDGDVFAAYGRVEDPLAGEVSRAVVARFDRTAGVWQDEIALSRGGARFGERGFIPALPRTRVAVRDDHVYVTWMQSAPGNTSYADIAVAWSTDDGATWRGPSGATTKPAGPGSSRSAFPLVVPVEGGAALVWDDRRHWTPPPPGTPLPPTAPVGAPDIYLNTVTLP